MSEVHRGDPVPTSVQVDATCLGDVVVPPERHESHRAEHVSGPAQKNSRADGFTDGLAPDDRRQLVFADELVPTQQTKEQVCLRGNRAPQPAHEVVVRGRFNEGTVAFSLDLELIEVYQAP